VLCINDCTHPTPQIVDAQFFGWVLYCIVLLLMVYCLHSILMVYCLQSRSRPTRIHVRVAEAIARPGRPLAGVEGLEGGRCGESIYRKLFLHTRAHAHAPLFTGRRIYLPEAQAFPPRTGPRALAHAPRPHTGGVTGPGTGWKGGVGVGGGGKAVTVTTGHRGCRGHPLTRICEIRVMCGPHGLRTGDRCPEGPGLRVTGPSGPMTTATLKVIAR
jgi:hypothetical protein